MSSWTPEMKAEVARRWSGGGETADAIALAIGVTKNAVIGAVHRMGLPPRGSPRLQRDDDRIRQVILETQTHDLPARNAALRLEMPLSTVQQLAAKWGVPFPKRGNGYVAGQRKRVGDVKTKPAPVPRKSIPGVRQDPVAITAPPEIAAYEAERRTNGAMTFLDNPSVGHCKMFLDGESGPFGLQCAASTDGVMDSWCQIHNAVVSAPVPARQQIYASRR